MNLPPNCLRFAYLLTLAACAAAVFGTTALMAYLTHDSTFITSSEPLIQAGFMAGTLTAFYLLFGFGEWAKSVPLRDRFRLAVQHAAYLAVMVPLGMAGGALIASYTPDNDLEGAWAMGAILAVLLPVFVQWLLRRGEADDGNFIRGTAMISFAAAQQRAIALKHEGEATLRWGGLDFPDRFSEGHFSLTGATGSAKTLAMRLLMQSALPLIKPGADHRALVYDAKCDMLSLLSGMGVEAPMVILNPFDARSAAWDMAKDITTPVTAHQVASILIPEEDGHNRYFSDAARAILDGVFNAFILRSPGVWTFRDVVLATRTEARLRELLTFQPETQDIVDQFFDDPRTLGQIKSTIASRMAVFSPIAALWSHAKTRISLQDWVAGESILVLGNDESLRAPLDAVNRVLFQRVVELVLNGTESRTRRTWFFFDEFQEAGKLKALASLLNKGRSKGARVVLGFQDIEALRNIYGPAAANHIAGMPANKALLRLDNESTAKWASGVLGEAEWHEYTESHTSGKESSTTTSEHIVKRDAVLPSQLLRLPLPENLSFWGYYIVPAVGVYKARRTCEGVLLPPGATPNFISRPVEEQYLRPWTADDLKRLGFERGVESESHDAPSDESAAANQGGFLANMGRLTLLDSSGEAAA